jgi:hypothetical protein
MGNDEPPVRLLESVSGSDLPDEDGADSDDVLNALELRLVELVAAGYSYEDTGALIGLSPRTCRRWAKRPEIAQAIKARASEQVAGARAILASGMSRAARSLVDMSDGKTKADSATVSAARCVVEATAKLVEMEELQTRLSELEAALAQQPGQPGFNRGRF